MQLRFFVLMLAMLSTASAMGGSTSVVDEVFDRYLIAVHAGDMDAVRAMIAPDVERSDYAGCRAEMDNPTCLAHYIETTVVKPRARMTELRRRVEGDTLFSDLEVRSPLYEQAGAPRILGQDIVRVRDGSIVAFRFVPDFSDDATATFFGTLGIGPRAPRQ